MYEDVPGEIRLEIFASHYDPERGVRWSVYVCDGCVYMASRFDADEKMRLSPRRLRPIVWGWLAVELASSRRDYETIHRKVRKMQDRFHLSFWNYTVDGDASEACLQDWHRRMKTTLHEDP